MKKFLILILSACLFFFSSTISQAHFLVTDKTIGILVHVDPDDAPIVGQTTHIHLTYKTKDDILTNTNCSCSIEILFDGKSVFSDTTNTLEGSDHTFMTDYVFPQKGIYTLHMTGTIQTTTAVTFDTTYDLRVDRESEHTETQTVTASTNILLLAVSAVAVAFVGMVLYLRLTKSK